jgi:mevalonate kinase
MSCFTAKVPAKVILIGEHAVNRGAMALAVSVGRYASVEVRIQDSGFRRDVDSGGIVLASGERQLFTSREAVLALGRKIDGWRTAEDYTAMQALAANDYFAPAVYVLAAAGEALPEHIDIRFQSEIPLSAGLGSGGAAFVALASCLAQLVGGDASPKQIAAWARRGDILAHGGVASGLDTQTSLYGGAIRYTAQHEGEPVPFAPGLQLVIGNSGVFAATSAVNTKVRGWLAERPLRMHYFAEIGLLARHAEIALRDGDWPELGRLMNMNQLILERIGVSCPELEQLNEAALAAGAYGAKLSGSGGGGIMVALVDDEHRDAVAAAIEDAGGSALIAPVGVAGTQ